MNLRRLLAIVNKEFRQLRRDRLTLAMIVGIPAMQLLLFGFAINLDVRGLRTAVLDQAQTQQSRELLAQLGASGLLALNISVDSPQALQAQMTAGNISAAVVIPADFEARLARGERPLFQLIVDGADQTVQQAAAQIGQFPLQQLRPGGHAPPPLVQILNLYNPERRAPLNSVPGLIGAILTMTMVLFTALALVRERERGNMEMLITTPVTPLELVLGKVLPFVIIGLVQVSLILLLGYGVFDVPVRGSVLHLYAVALLFILASLALGIFISTRARSQFQAMQMTFFTFLPQILLSGFMFPFDGMPQPAQWLGQLLPLTHFVRLVRGIMLRAASPLDQWPSVLALLAIAAVLLLAALGSLRKRLD